MNGGVHRRQPHPSLMKGLTRPSFKVSSGLLSLRNRSRAFVDLKKMKVLIGFVLCLDAYGGGWWWPLFHPQRKEREEEIKRERKKQK